MSNEEFFRRPEHFERYRCDAGIRRILRMSDDEIITAKKRDDKRVKVMAERIKKLPLDKKFTLLRNKPNAYVLQPEERKFSIRTDLLGIAPHPHFGAVILDKRRLTRVKIRAIVDFSGNSDDLTAMGITVNGHVQNIFAILATKEQLAHLAAQAATRKIRIPRLFFPTLDDAGPTAEIDNLHAVGAEGDGTIVGIIDSPLHVEHHAFQDPGAGHSSRVLFMWVQDPEQPGGGAVLPGQTPEQYSADPAHPGAPDFTGLNYGRIYDQAYINGALALASTYGTGPGQIAKTPDPLDAEHGTHTAGIAVGSGHVTNWATAPTEIGSAPLADIVHVCRRWSFENLQTGVWEDDIINALDFIFRVATNAGQAVVVSVSLGTNVGPHSGLSEFDVARDAFLDSQRGRSIVWSAGNDDDDDAYRNGTITAGSSEAFNLQPLSVWRDLWLDVWYSGPELEFKMDSGGDTTGWQGAGSEFNGNVNGYDIEVDRDLELASGRRGIRLYVQSPNANWTVNLRNPTGGGNVQYWAWIGAQGWWHNMSGTTHGELTLSDTGCARSILTVGACDKQVGNNPEIISAYSGRGPTLQGTIKPEIVAVGSNVMSADSRTTGGYVSMSGTSMATPLVGGAVALLLENDPTLNQDAIKALLTQTADQTNLHLNPLLPGYDRLARNAYGHGRVRLLAPFQHSMPLVNVDLWVKTAVDDYGAEPYPGGCFCHAPEVTILGPGGNPTTILHWDKEHTIRVRIHNLGQTPAFGVRAEIRYTRPWAAPDDWEPCRDAHGMVISETFDIPDLDFEDVEFGQLWVPHEAEIPPGGAEWGDHYCLLVEVFHADDPWTYGEPASAGGDPWTRNIKGVNNVALRNLSIH